MGYQYLQHLVAVMCDLLLAQTIHLAQVRLRAGLEPDDPHKLPVAGDHVGRDALGLGPGRPPRAQGIEEDPLLGGQVLFG
jgi:hypothetical protein